MGNSLSPFFFFNWFRDYSIPFLIKDTTAGLTVAAVYVPQAMAYALLAGMPPITGLYTAFIATVVAAFFGSSRFLNTGPVAMTCLLSASVLYSFQLEPQTDKWVSYMALLALLVGLIRLSIGLLRFGFIVDLISHSVVIGFTSAGALVIALSQLGHLFGFPVEKTTQLIIIILDIFLKINELNPYTFFLGILAFLVIVLSRKVSPYIPGALIAVFVTSFLVYHYKLYNYGVDIVGKVPQGLPAFSLPVFDLKAFSAMGGGAVVVALFGLIEAVAIAKTLAIRVGDRWDPNRELVGQGLANIAVAFFKGFPAGGSFSRSSLNFTLGAKTPLASVITGILVGFTLLYLAPYFYYLPKATLSAIVLSAVIDLIKPWEILKLYRINPRDGLAAGITFSSVFFLDLWVAITLGIVVSFGSFLYRTMYPKIVVLTRDPQSGTFVNVEGRDLPQCPQILYIRPNTSIYFGNAQYVHDYIVDKVLQRRKTGVLKYVLLDMEAVNNIDAAGTETIIRLIKTLKNTGLEVAFANIGCDVYSLLERAGFDKVVNSDLVFDSKGQSVAELLKKVNFRFCKEKCPYKVFVECEKLKK